MSLVGDCLAPLSRVPFPNEDEVNVFRVIVTIRKATTASLEDVDCHSQSPARPARR